MPQYSHCQRDNAALHVLGVHAALGVSTGSSSQGSQFPVGSRLYIKPALSLRIE
jgi:hypothetical protein